MSTRLPLPNIVDETNNSIINKTDILFIISIQNVDLKVFDIIFKELNKMPKKKENKFIKIYYRKTIKNEQEHRIYYDSSGKKTNVKTNYESLYFSGSSFDNLINYKVDLYQKNKLPDSVNITSSDAEISVRREFEFDVTIKGFTWLITLTVYYQQALVLDGQTQKKLKEIRVNLGDNPDSFDDFVIFMNSKNLNVRYKIDIKLKKLVTFTIEDVKNIIGYLKTLINPNHSEDIIKSNILKNIAKITKPYALKNPSRIFLKNILPGVTTLNRSVFDQIKKLDGFYVTEKADGDRAVLYIDNKTVAIVSSKLHTGFEKSKKVRDRNSVTMVQKTIIDGEFVDGVFYGFDIICLKNEVIMDLKFPERMKRLTEGIKIAIDLGVKAHAKTYHLVDPDKKESAIRNVYEGKYPYEIDGLIFTDPSETYGNTKHYKWKPAENNTIDFLMVKVTPSLIDFTKFDEEYDKTLTQYFLFTGVSIDIFKRYGLKYCEGYDEIFKEKPKGYFPIQFSPSTKKYAYLYQGEEGFDKTIGEFLLRNNKWELIRIREDRQSNYIAGNYFGNDYKTAESVWMNYMDPILLENLWTGISGVYFTTTKDNKHKYQTSVINFAKRNTIKTLAYTQVILDIGAGKGQDLNKYLEQGIQHLIAVDLDTSALIELVRRKHETRIKSNMRVDVMNANMNDNFMENVKKIRKAFDIVKLPVIVCNLAVHYFLVNEETAINFINFVDTMLEPGGKLVLTFMDGNRVHENLDDIRKGETYDIKNPEDEHPKFSIKKLYNGPMGNEFGKEIGVLLPFSNNDYYNEYLVNTDLLIEKFGERNIKPISNKQISSVIREFDIGSSNISKQKDSLDEKWLSLFQELIFQKDLE